MMFSATVWCGKRLKCWKTMPIFWRTWLMSVFLSVRSRPSTMTLPDVTSSKRFRQRKKVDLPEPDGPITATTSPWLIVVEMPLRTSFEPNDLWRSVTSIMVLADSLTC